MPKKIASLKIVSIAELGGIVGKNPRTIYQWITKGMPVHEKGEGQGSAHKLNAPDCIEWLVNQEKGGANDAAERYEVSRADKMEAESKLTAIELEKMRGTVVEVPIAIRIFQDRLAAVRGSLQSLPSRSAIACAAASTREDTRKILEDEVNSIMASIAAEFGEDVPDG